MNKNDGKTSTTLPVVDKSIRVRILVVDDDKICLAVTTSVLKLFNYEVVTINCPLEALSTLRMNQDAFDIILSDVHMPLMNGLNFQRIVEIEFQIPVILMSADDQKDLLLKSLESGAAFFIVKPPSISDLKNMWQYVISRKNSSSNKSSLGKEIEPYNEMLNKKINNEVFPQITYTNNEDFSDDYQKKPLIVQKVENTIEEKSACSNNKKPKLIWTNALHNKFLEAISVIGISRAVPKKILEYMNIPGLTRENIASHLQKYRIYVRRLSDSNASMQHGMPVNWNERPFRSSFSWSQFPTLANNSFLLKYSNPTNHSPTQTRTSLPNYGPQHNPYLHPSNPFTQQSANNEPMNILESSGLDPQSKRIYDEGDVNVALQFVTPKQHNGGSSMRMTKHYYSEKTQPFMSNPHHNILSFEMSNDISYTNNGLMGSTHPKMTSQQYQYFDGAFDNMANNITQMSGFETHNNNVDNYFMTQPVVNMSSNFHSNEQFPVTNLNIISNDQQVTITSKVNAISTDQEGGKPNITNISNGVAVVGDENVNRQTRDLHDKDTTTSAPIRDWAPNQLEDFSMDYGMADLSTMFSNIDAPKENNN